MMNVHRLAVNNISDREIEEHQNVLELWMKMKCWICLLHQKVKVLEELLRNCIKWTP